MSLPSQFAVSGSGRFAQVDHVAQTGSTNDDLLAVAPTSPTHPRVLIADEQVAGRGRRDRTWTMPPGGGLLTSFFVPWIQADTAHMVPTCLGVAAVNAIAEHDRDVLLKWPNDLVDASDRKLGGMLSSAVVDDGRFIGVVAGLGCNVSWPTPDVVELANATCLDRLAERPINRADLATSLIRAFDDALSSLESAGPIPMHDQYRQRCRTIGQQVRVERGAGDLIGTATDIDPSGALLLDVDGVQHRVDVGDVVHLRPQ